MASGDFKIDAATKEKLKFKCQTLKEVQYSEQKRTTAGGLFIVSACGLFVGVRELYGSESLTQVHLFLLELFTKHEVPLPTVLAYDDACRMRSPLTLPAPLDPTSTRATCAPPRALLLLLVGGWRAPADLLKFMQLRRERSAFTAGFLSKVKLVVDRFHWRNHKDEKFCALHVNPGKCAELGPATNTEAAEEVSARAHA